MADEQEPLSDEDDDDECPETAEPPPMGSMRSRTSVSAEAFGEWNKRVLFVPPTYPKTAEQVELLTSVLSSSFLFYSLEAKDLEVVVMAMKGPCCLDPGLQIITEGDDGHALYVVTEGSLDCSKFIDGSQIVVKTCQRGDIFGELALLYSCPRAASVICREASTVVWELDRETFTNIVMDAVQRKRSQCCEALRRVPLFAEMSQGEMENIIDAMKQETYPQGATIIMQGEMGEHFYIVYSGQATATRVTADNAEPMVMLHQVGDYFGELALLRNEPRAATVVASSEEVCLMSMDRMTFKRLMGPAEEFLQRGTLRYG